MKSAKWWVVIGGSAAVVSLLLVFGLAGTNGRGHPGPVTIEIFHASAMTSSLLVYAEEHGGQFPPALTALSQGAVPPMAGRFHDPVTKEELDWIYYGGYSRVANPNAQGPPGPVILASPRVVQRHQRIVVYADGSAGLEDEDHFVKLLSKQLNDRLR